MRIKLVLRILVLSLLVVLVPLAGPQSNGTVEAQPAQPVTANANAIRVRILGINDFHGALDSTVVTGRPIGGAAVLSSYMDHWTKDADTMGFEGTIRVASGDLIGASPPNSALLQDEPTIQVLSRMKLRMSSVGNHEFDEGLAELVRLTSGGCHPNTGCFRGSGFQYLAANVVHESNNEPIFPPYVIERVKDVSIGFIGIVLRDTPTIVTPTGVAGLRFLDEATTVNRYVTNLKAQGVETIVVLIHQGGSGNRTGLVQGDILPIVNAFNDEVDVVVSGHTHQGYQGLVGSKLVTQSFSNGTAIAVIDLTISNTSGQVVAKSAQLIDTWADTGPGLTPDPQIAGIVARANATVAPQISRVVGTAAGPITRTQNAAGESALGDFIADAQRKKMGTDVGFMNPGGIRADIAAGTVTWGNLFTVQPFNNDLVKMTLTGAQIEQLLEQQWTAPQPTGGRILQVSGIQYSWNPSAPIGTRVDPANIRICNPCVPLNLGGTYTATVNSFMATGGDNFTVLINGTNRVVGPVDLLALVEYVEGLPQPFSQTIAGRITTSTASPAAATAEPFVLGPAVTLTAP